jgi:hypothetical protein
MATIKSLNQTFRMDFMRSPDTMDDIDKKQPDK